MKAIGYVSQLGKIDTAEMSLDQSEPTSAVWLLILGKTLDRSETSSENICKKSWLGRPELRKASKREFVNHMTVPCLSCGQSVNKPLEPTEKCNVHIESNLIRQHAFLKHRQVSL